MIVLGGVTRLTRAGLSITTWDPVTGVVPPLNARGWEHAFELYRSSPEGRLRADEMGIVAFRQIYLVEWAHRLLGRTLALVLVGPLVAFGVRRTLPRTVLLRLGGILVAGGVQAVVGWLMVQSGLVSVPHVSPYRLTVHLALGVALFVAMLWSALDAFGRSSADFAPRAGVFTVVDLVTANVVLLVLWGGLMAGHHAGLVFSDFPTMGGALVPSGAFSDGPQAVFTDAVTVHFVHRALALSLTVFAALLFVRTRYGAPLSLRRRAALLLAVTGAQVVLGAATVMQHVPLVLAAAHQACGVALVAVVTSVNHALRGKRAL